MIITRERAIEIAQDAMNNAGYDIEQFVGYYVIWNADNDINDNWAVAINKEQDDNGGDKHFAIYMSSFNDESVWEYTDSLDINELADTLVKLAEGIDAEYKKGE